MVSNVAKELQGKKIIITGCSGHLGLRVVRNLIENGIKPTLLLHQDHPDIKKIIDEFKVEWFRCDISNKEEVKNYANFLGEVDTVIHLAAYVPKKVEEDDFELVKAVNLVGTMNLVSTLKPGSQLIFASTCEVYGIPNHQMITEDHPLRPLSYYGWSKAAAEMALKVHCHHHNINLTILRFTNIYGPGELIQRAIPNFIEAVLAKKDLQIYGDGSDLRDFLYVDDAANYVISAIGKEKSDTYNIATGKNYTIKEVAEKIIALSKIAVKIVFLERKKVKIDYIFDISKAVHNLGYAPETSLDQGLQKEIEWFRTKTS